MKYHSKKAFTLAEVLITLGIIGIVAALTIPTLMANQRKKAVETKLKKFYTTMSQAVIMSEIENGPSSEWILDFQNNRDPLTFYNNYLAKYLLKINTKKVSPGSYGVTIYLSDGTAFKLYNGACADIEFYLNHEKASIPKDKNIAGKDYFNFRICNEHEAYYAGGKFGGFQTASQGSFVQRMDRDYLLEHCKTPFADGNTCSALIEFDGWEIKKDYPHRFWTIASVKSLVEAVPPKSAVNIPFANVLNKAFSILSA